MKRKIYYLILLILVTALLICGEGVHTQSQSKDVSLKIQPQYINSTSDTACIIVHSGWNMISLPLEVPDGSKKILFPSATSDAFTYQNGYVKRDNLIPGAGYWLKFAQAETVKIVGTFKYEDTISLRPRWNMIGTFSVPISIDSIGSNPPNIVKSDYYYYSHDSGYIKATILEPGKAYWVKASQNGKIIPYCWDYLEDVLVEPLNNSFIDSLTLMMKWKRSPCVSSYHLQIATDSLLENFIVNDSAIIDTFYQLVNLEVGKTYYWRVGLCANNLGKIWSNLWNFSIIQWDLLGFEDKSAIRLVLVEPFLYVCAGADGLWRKNIRQSGDFEYLGLADSNLYYCMGVQDVVVNTQHPNWLLVAYETKLPTEHVIYRSFDEGLSWNPADSGLEYDGGLYYYPIYRLSGYSDTILSVSSTLYKTTNFGDNWNCVLCPGGTQDLCTLERHSLLPNIIAIGGTTMIETPIFEISHDFGNTWQGYFPHELSCSPIYCISFDPLDTNIIYAGNVEGIYKSTSGGESWFNTTYNNPMNMRVSKILVVHQNSNRIWASEQNSLSVTKDAGAYWQSINTPIKYYIWDMVWDNMNEVIYIGTSRGIYILKQ